MKIEKVQNNMKPDIIFFCGPHCSGKTTILKTLYKEGLLNSWKFEIGKDLFYKRRLKTEIQDANFEFEVSELELKRDLEIAENETGLVGIETWHPGNLAYAMVRNAQIVPNLIEIMKTSPLIQEAHGIWLHIPAEVIFQRTKTFENDRAWAADFYTKIENNLQYCLKELGLQDRIISIDSNRELTSVIEDVKSEIRNFKGR